MAVQMVCISLFVLCCILHNFVFGGRSNPPPPPPNGHGHLFPLMFG